MKLIGSNLREVVLYPTRQWGGEGLVGCGIGYVPSLFQKEMLISDTVFYIVYPARQLHQQQSSVPTVISHLIRIAFQEENPSTHPERTGRQHRLNLECHSCHVIICLCIARVPRSSSSSTTNLELHFRYVSGNP